MKIFDSLSHIKKDGNWFNTGHDAGAERLLKEFNGCLEKTLLAGMPGDDLDYLLRFCEKYPDKFIPIAPVIFHSETGDCELEEQISKYKQNGFRGIKIHPRLLNTDLTDHKIRKSVKLAGKYDLISLLCTVHKPPSKPLKRPVSDVIHEICDETQNCKLILLHGGYCDILATSEMVRSYENVLLDLSNTIMRFRDTHILSDIKFLFKTFDRRICIGSDFPEYSIYDVIDLIENRITYENFSNDKKENILFDNLNNFAGCHE
ncbi:MAG: hypothetical protein CSB55_03515 [Candidatus Cloacimonadota bacterium]|nr:MAG: hypothetical protein CSB55_03515 [Candidatus Cloacimonadota bacterium]